MDVPELLRRAISLVPTDVRSNAGLSAGDVSEYLRYDEWEVALGVLEDFSDSQWQIIEFWDLLRQAAEQMRLERDVAWCQWRGWEARNGLIRADLRLVAPESGGRRTPIPGAGQLRAMWAIGCQGTEGRSDLHVARIWVESLRELQPGGQGTVRLAPLTPLNWLHLRTGDVITMHEQRTVAGTATIKELMHPRHSPAGES